ncbi:Multidrug and toxin extrusion protein 1-like [Oopsacas minuta]|uniref:Multidrug and toxin extrusion protein n=1 Tax=Oopsacas minuta TaxID=111878 RepID=A0AAV7KBB7_9METZ|nr:Multidrug and toxin extrusion protein 1-like [Oopsacas minuta]
MVRAEISDIQYTFQGLTSLSRLALEGNRITKLVSNEFKDLKSLTYLDLDGNGIQEVNKDALTGLDGLKYLSISANPLFPLQMLSYLSGLTVLQINYNSYRTLSPEPFEQITNIRYIYADNPFFCDCSLRWTSVVSQYRVYFLSSYCLEPSRVYRSSISTPSLYTNCTGNGLYSCFSGTVICPKGFICRDTPTGAACTCEDGYILHSTGECTDEDECKLEQNNCEQNCKNTIGSYECHCDIGYVLGDDGISCLDIDECIAGTDICTNEEVKFLTLLALPTSIMCLTEGFQMKLSNVFVGRASGEDVSTELSALFIGQMVISCSAYSLSEGLSVCVSILCSQAHGANQHRLVVLYYYRVLMLLILLCFPLFSLYVSVGPIVYLITQNWELSVGAGNYTNLFCFGFPAYAYYKISVCFLQSQNTVWIPLLYLLVGNLFNGILQYIFIFNYNLGIAGSAAAYVVSNYIIALLIFAHLKLSSQILSHAEFTIDLIKDWYHTAKYAFPAIMQIIIIMAVSNIFPIIILLLISHDKNQLAIYSIMYSVWFLFMLFTMGYERALTIRVGHLLGANTVTKAKKSAIFGMAFAETIVFSLSVLAMLFHRTLSVLFTTDDSFIKELHLDLLLQPIIILSDIIVLGQGVMNACGMQQIFAVMKFFFLFVLGFIAEVFLVKYFARKALAMYSILGLLRVSCFVTAMILLFSRDWNKFTLKKTNNIQLSDSLVELLHEKNPSSQFFEFGKFLDSKLFIITRYVICLIIGVSMLVVAMLQLR